MFWLFVYALLTLSVLTCSQFTRGERNNDKGRARTNNVAERDARKSLLVKKGFDDFREVIKRKVEVDDEMVNLSDVKKWFDREFTSKKKEFNPQDLTLRAVSDLASIWCSYCQSINRCACIRRFCFNARC